MFKMRMLVPVWLLISCNLYGQSADSTSTKDTDPLQTYIDGAIKSDSGFVNYYMKDQKHLMQIPDEVLGRDILISTTILKGAAENHRTASQTFGYGGDAVHDQMIRLVRHEDKIEILEPYIYHVEDSAWIYKKSFEQINLPVKATLKIVASSDNTCLVDFTTLFEGDNSLFSLKGVASMLGMTGYVSEESYPLSVDAHPGNINFKSIRTYNTKDPANSTYPTARWEIGVCWMLLPEKPMKMRIKDDRVGYFGLEVRGQFHSESLNEMVPVACRWRLEPKPEDVDRYLRGELVEPAKPIVFYIDRATPEYLIPYMIQAVNNWQVAFERAGFKNAIRGELAPTLKEDPNYSEEDTRYSLISYKASPVANAYGPMTTDPRSGEVLSSHIGVFHTIMDLLQRWYFVMCASVDPSARQYPVPQEVMGKLARTVVSHEVGHTLGLFHNFIGSDLYDLENLRDHEFIQAHGLGASIMDYQRFNFLSRPEDGLTQDDLLPRIGPYDWFAIEWGYRYYPDTIGLAQLEDRLQDWVTEKRKDKSNRFIIETDSRDPRSQPEDSGSDLLETNEAAIANLKNVMAHLLEWTPDTGPNNEVLRWRYLSVQEQYRNYIMHIVTYIGGSYTDNPLRGEPGKDYSRPIEKETQLQALEFINTHFFEEPKWLFQKEIMDKTNFDYEVLVREALADFIIPRLVVRYVAFDQGNASDPDAFAYEQLLTFLTTSLVENKCNTGILSKYDRRLQQVYVEQLMLNAENISNLMSKYGITLKLELSKVKSMFEKTASTTTDAMIRMHCESMVNLITIWETGDQKLDHAIEQ